MRGGDAKSSTGYYKKWAWSAQTYEEHLLKKKIYGSFWRAVERLGARQRNPFFVFCHTLSSRPKNLPSALDLVTGRGKWISKNRVKKIASRLNVKYDFNTCKREWKQPDWSKILERAVENIYKREQQRGISQEEIEQRLSQAKEEDLDKVVAEIERSLPRSRDNIRGDLIPKWLKYLSSKTG